MYRALAERVAQFNLELHPEKTRLIRFGRFARRDSALDGRTRPETFDFLGSTHICAGGPGGKSRVVRRTARKKRVAKLAALKVEIERRKHHRVVEQHAWLSSVMRGHFNYYGVPGNFPALASFRHRVRFTGIALCRGEASGRTGTKRSTRLSMSGSLCRAPESTHDHPLSRFSRP